MLITRSRPQSAPAVNRTIVRRAPPPVAQAVAAAPVRRLRFATANNAVSRAAKEDIVRAQIDEKLQLIAIQELALDEAAAALEVTQAETEALMRNNNLSDHTDGKYRASIEQAITRQSMTIDPKKFKANVPDKDFWKVCEIPIGKAKDLLSKKELDAIADVVPAKAGAYVFKLKKIERKVK